MAWYEEAFGADYLDLYAHRDEEEAERTIAFVATRLFAAAPPRRILDLACGAGRHTMALVRRGCPVFGIDLSLELLARSPALPRLAGDMRGLPVADRSFDWVLNFFTSFGYFPTEPENFRVLQEVVRVLEPGGHCLFDLMNLDATLAHLREYEVREAAGGQRVEIHRWWDPQQRRVNKRIRLGTPEHEPRTFHESVRGYSRDEVTIGMRWAGLEVTETFGSFAGEPYGEQSERLILVGRRVV